MWKSLKIAVTASFIAALSFSTSTAQIPQLGSASDVVWSRSEELSIGKTAYNRLLRNGDIFESAADIDYLSYLGNKIASYADTRLGLHFYLTRSTSVNAFASPGGYVGVNAGLVLTSDNEHELAGVLAHEIAHVSQEHIARTVLSAKNRQLTNAAAIVGSVLMASQGGGQLGAASLYAVMAGETQAQINDIRRHEIEADNEGRRLMRQAGFNELGMQTFFGKLYVPNTMNDAPSYLLTHPLPQRRQAALDTLQARSKSLHSRDEYYLFRARIRSEFLSQADVEQIILQEQSDANPQIRQASIYLSALQAMKYGRVSEALSHLVKLSSGMSDNRDVQLMQAKLYLLDSQAEKATQIYQNLWQRYSGDSVVAYDYAQFLMQQGDFQMAAEVMSEQTDASLNPQLYWLYGEILERLGRIDEQQRILIRYYRETGQYERALNQAQIASKKPGIDWQARAGFEAQEKELQRIIKRLEEFE